MVYSQDYIKPQQVLTGEEPSAITYILVLIIVYAFVNIVGYDIYEQRRPSLQ